MDKKLSILDLNLHGKRVVMRVDFNVPLGKDGSVRNTLRIDATMPTINHALSNGASVVLLSHLGRPDGKIDPASSLRPVFVELQKRLPNNKVTFLPDCVGDEVQRACAALTPGQVVLCENVRFHLEEEGSVTTADGQKLKADDAKVAEFRRQLSALGDYFVNDAFGAAHRAHSSVVGLNLPRASGLLMKKELDYFSKVLEKPQRPLLAILGGAKVADKIKLIYNMIDRVDEILIGGGMSYTFLKVINNVSIGKSLFDAEGAKIAHDIFAKAQSKNVKIHLPVDHVCGDKWPPTEAQASTTDNTKGIADGLMGMDIGEKTCKLFADRIAAAHTIIWNGPVGCFEADKFAEGTRFVGQCLVKATQRGCITVVGGGDTATAADKFQISASVSHVSTGGGASMELLEGKALPGVTCLTDKQ